MAPTSPLGSVAPKAAHSLLRFPSSNRRHHRRDIEFMFSFGSRANEVGVYLVSLSEPRPRFGWLLFSQRLVV
jgi:hypothetical protein